MLILECTLCFIGVFRTIFAEKSHLNFPENFQFGVASSAYQIEGGWNEGGKGESIWDHSLHANPNKSNGDVACDSYHKWKEDIVMLKNLGIHFYRFSISWTRILPLGYKDSEINTEGVKYYDDLINGLLAEGIEPFVTIYHWDLPQTLQNKGGWLNYTIVDDFVYYAEQLFKHYGDRVKRWITINEFLQICEYGYSNAILAPYMKSPGVGVYQCSHNLLLAHGMVYRLYETEFKKSQKGEVGASIHGFWCEPRTSSQSDHQAAEQYMQFNFGFYAHPIIYGNYPPIMIERIEALSKQQGFNKSRLPKFTNEQVEIMKGSFDFIGLNHYTTFLCSSNDSLPQPSLDSDSGAEISQNSSWKGNSLWWLRHVPWGFRKILIWMKESYGNPRVFVTESGWSTDEKDLNDIGRIQYYRDYLSEMLKAIYEDGCSVIGFTAWSFIDDFEWDSGYKKKFGLIYVDFENENKTRIPRSSYTEYKNIISSNKIPNASVDRGYFFLHYFVVLSCFLKFL